MRASETENTRKAQTLKGIGNSIGMIKRATAIRIRSKYSSFILKIKCLVMDEIVDFIPDQYTPTNHWNFLIVSL